MQPVCSPIAMCWDSMHRIKDKPYSSLNVSASPRHPPNVQPQSEYALVMSPCTVLSSAPLPRAD